MKPLSTKERMRRLIANHNEHMNAIMLNFANQFHELATQLVKEEELKHGAVANAVAPAEAKKE